MRLRDTKDAYDYICTHVDDFKVVAHDANMLVNRITQAFLVNFMAQGIITLTVITNIMMEKICGHMGVLPIPRRLLTV